MGFNLVQKTFICDKLLKSYARLNALNNENVNAKSPGSNFSVTTLLKIIKGTHVRNGIYCRLYMLHSMHSVCQ